MSKPSKFFPSDRDPFEVADERMQKVKDWGKKAEESGDGELSEFFSDVSEKMESFNWLVLPLSADFTYSILLIKKPWLPLRTYPKDLNIIVPGGKKTRDRKWIRSPIPSNSFRIPEVGPVKFILGLIGKFIIMLNLRYGYEDPKAFKINGLQSFLSIHCSGHAIFVCRGFHTNKEVRDKYYSDYEKKLFDCYTRLKPKIGHWLALQIAEIKYGGFGFNDKYDKDIEDG